MKNKTLSVSESCHNSEINSKLAELLDEVVDACKNLKNYRNNCLDPFEFSVILSCDNLIAFLDSLSIFDCIYTKEDLRIL